MDEARAGISTSDVAPDSASEGMSGDSRDDELTHYPDDKDGDDQDFC